MREIYLLVAVVAASFSGVLCAGTVRAQDIKFGPIEPDTKPQRRVPPRKAVTPPPAEAVPSPAPKQDLAPGTPKLVSDTKFPPPRDGCQNTANFEGWLQKFEAEAVANGVSRRTIAAALDGMTLDSGIIARDRRQGFFAQSFLDFQAKLATVNRLQNGRAQIAKNKATFERVKEQFGVPASVITGFWALESDFGVGMGKLPILRSLVALAYDCRRSDMFRAELLAALKVIDRGDMRPADMIGSWAGEIGQTQFLPTRYLDHAIDYDGDGRPNLFRSEPDIIASTAKYMKHLGWRPGEPWLEEVRVPGQVPWEEADLAIKHPRSKWAGWGVTRADGSALPRDGLPASLLLPMGRFGPAFLAYPNFAIYLEWNQSLTYATTAAYLATRIDGAAPMRRPSTDIPVLDLNDSKDLQRLLAKRGYDVGKIDGLLGAKSRSAVKAMQIKFGMPADSYPTPELLAALRNSS